MEIFLKMSRGNRTEKLGLKGKLRFSKDYTAVMVDARGIVTKDEVELQTSANKGKTVVLVGDQMITPKGEYRAIIDVNPELYHYGQVNCVSIIEPKSGVQPQVHIKLSRNLDLDNIDYLYRIYCAGL